MFSRTHFYPCLDVPLYTQACITLNTHILYNVLGKCMMWSKFAVRVTQRLTARVSFAVSLRNTDV